MPAVSLQIIREEHASIAAVLRSLQVLVDQGRATTRPSFFDGARAILSTSTSFLSASTIPESPSTCSPRGAACANVAEVIARLDAEHVRGEAAVRKLQHCCWPGS